MSSCCRRLELVNKRFLKSNDESSRDLHYPQGYVHPQLTTGSQIFSVASCAENSPLTRFSYGKVLLQTSSHLPLRIISLRTRNTRFVCVCVCVWSFPLFISSVEGKDWRPWRQMVRKWSWIMAREMNGLGFRNSQRGIATKAHNDSRKQPLTIGSRQPISAILTHPKMLLPWPKKSASGHKILKRNDSRCSIATQNTISSI